jgi:hypothetical protein
MEEGAPGRDGAREGIASHNYNSTPTWHSLNHRPVVDTVIE